MLSSTPTILTSSLPVSLAMSNSAFSSYSPPMQNQSDDNYRKASVNKVSTKPVQKGKVPSWLAWAIEFIVPSMVIMSFHRLPLTQLTAKARMLLSCSVAGISTGVIDYWRQKNNEGRVSWANWAINTGLASTPFELFMAKRS